MFWVVIILILLAICWIFANQIWILCLNQSVTYAVIVELRILWRLVMLFSAVIVVIESFTRSAPDVLCSMRLVKELFFSMLTNIGVYKLLWTFFCDRFYCWVSLTFRFHVVSPIVDYILKIVKWMNLGLFLVSFNPVLFVFDVIFFYFENGHRHIAS